MTKSIAKKTAGLLVLALLVLYGVLFGLTGSPTLEMQAQAQTGGTVPGNVRGDGTAATPEMWRAIRKGVQGQVSIPDKQAGVLVQSEGDNFRAFRNGPLSTYGGWLMLAVVVIVALFFAVRGRIKIDAGPSGRTIERFNTIDRFTHWLTATSFIVLAITGLNVLYGKYVLLPIVGKSAFGLITYWGKLAHNYIAFAFMLGVVMMLVLWVRHNIPNMHDLKWLAMGGGLFSKGVHPPAEKFNAGQKILFWAVVLGGFSIALSGFCLLFPFEYQPFAPTFKLMNAIGFSLPTTLTPLQETQLALLWHGVVGLILIAIIIGHIYIGSLGMEGALDAVTTGQVDENWAREHHPLWYAEVKGETPGHH